MSITRLSGGLTPADGSDPRTFPTIFNAAADYIEQLSISGNAIINGDFGIWQRGTAFTGLTTDTYTADRWRYSDSGATASISRQSFTPADIEAVGYGDAKYFLRYDVTTGDANTSMQQDIEDVRTFAGQQVTVSFWAKADAAFSNMQVYGVQNFGSGGSSVNAFGISSFFVDLTTSWQRFSKTFDVPSVSGKTIGDGSYLRWAWLINTADTPTIDLWGVQVEAGPVATPFRLAGGGSKAAELALCQRYYQRAGETNNSYFGSGVCHTTTKALVPYVFPTEMRVAPSLSFSGTFKTAGASGQTGLGLVDNGAATSKNCVLQVTGQSNTVGDACVLSGEGSGSVIELDAEL